MSLNKWNFILIAGVVFALIAGSIPPSKMVIPVQGATRHDWNHQTFWNERWGRSGVHKGIDIFSTVGQPVISASHGIVVYTGKRPLGGNAVVILGPRWQLHYYAHLKDIDTRFLSLVKRKESIGSVGRTGNAKNKPAHLHYSVMSLLPMPWRSDESKQGWKKAFFMDPTYLLLSGHQIKLAKKSPQYRTERTLAENSY